MFSSTSTQLTCGFKVNTTCPEWHKSMTRILKHIKGGEFSFDAEEGMAYVSGQGDPNKLLKLMGSIKCNSAQMVFLKTGVRHHQHQHQHQHQHRHHQPHHNLHNNSYFNSKCHYNSYCPSDLSYSWQLLPYYAHSSAMQPYHHKYSYGPDYHRQVSYDPADYPHQEYY